MKSDRYKVVQNPHGGWAVQEIGSDGIIKSFSSKSEAEEFLRKVSEKEPYDTPVVLDISDMSDEKEAGSKVVSGK